jgi:hypothetical protein
MVRTNETRIVENGDRLELWTIKDDNLHALMVSCESKDRGNLEAWLKRLKEDDNDEFVTEEWIHSFFGNDEDADISIEMGEDGREEYVKWGIRISVPRCLAQSMLRDDVRRIAAYLRSYDDDQRCW